MKYESTRLKQMLAAEYVVGTLAGAARRRFRRLLEHDRWLRGEVRYWEERFAELGIFEPVPPREIVWAEIEHRIRAGQGRVAEIEPRVQRMRLSLSFWRVCAGLATAASLVMAVLLLRGPAQPLAGTVPQPRVVEVRVPAQAYVAALRLPQEDAQWTVSVLPDTRSVRVIASGPARLSVKEDYELWWLSDSGSVTSLGLLPRSGAWEALLPVGIQASANAKLAVSLEPAGGSPAQSGPSGPVLLAAPLIPSI